MSFNILIWQLKFIYSEKATTFCKIFTLLLSYVVPVKSKVKISHNYVAFSEYMNFNKNVQVHSKKIVKTLLEIFCEIEFLTEKTIDYDVHNF